MAVFRGPVPAGTFDAEEASWQVRADDLPYEVQAPITMGVAIVADDLSGDGVADLVVTSPDSSPVVEQEGAVYLWEGPIAADRYTTGATATLHGDIIYDMLGIDAQGLGDTDGDGYRELGVGSRGGTLGDAWIINGMPQGTAGIGERARTRFQGIDELDILGGVFPAGDLDNDGFDDIAVTASEIGDDKTGGVYVFYGPLPVGSYRVDDCASAIVRGGSENNPPWDIAAGDYQGDGVPDLAVGQVGGVFILAGAPP